LIVKIQFAKPQTFKGQSLTDKACTTGD